MKITLAQAMLILNYIISHSSDISKVAVMVTINGVYFQHSSFVSSFRDTSFRKKEMIQAIKSVLDDNGTLLTNVSECCGKKTLLFF